MDFTEKQKEEIKLEALKLCEKQSSVTPEMKAAIGKAKILEVVSSDKLSEWQFIDLGTIWKRTCRLAYEITAGVTIVALVLSSEENFFGTPIVEFWKPKNAQIEVQVYDYWKNYMVSNEPYPVKPVTPDEVGKLIVFNNTTFMTSPFTGSQYPQGNVYIAPSGLSNFNSQDFIRI